MNGRQLADEARRRAPGLKVLFTTGYARNAIVHDGRLDPGVELITKPFTYRQALAAKLRGRLDATAGRGASWWSRTRRWCAWSPSTCWSRSASGPRRPPQRPRRSRTSLRVAGAHIDAAIVDVGLPDRRGDALAAELRALYADLPIVIASGYGEETVARPRRRPARPVPHQTVRPRGAGVGAARSGRRSSGSLAAASILGDRRPCLRPGAGPHHRVELATR